MIPLTRFLFALLVIFLITARISPAQPSPSLTDFWNTNAVWVSDANNIGRPFGFHFLSAITNGTEIWAYYINNHRGTSGTIKSATGRARSRDGLHWLNDGIVMDVGGETKWDNRLASFPGIWKDGNTWYLVYEGAAEDIPFSPGDIGLATSTNGINFVKQPNPILRHNTSGWERVNIGTPSLYKEKDAWYLFYHGFDGTRVRIGVASGASLTNLTKAAANPILTCSVGANAWDSGTIGKRSAIVKEGSYYYFAFEGSTPQPFDHAKWSSGLARTMNLTNTWTEFPVNPVIPQTIAGFGFDGPELIQIRNVWYMYVRTSDETAPTKRFRLTAKPPKIMAPATNQTVFAGGTTAFSVSASSTPPLTYKWSFDTNNLSGVKARSQTQANVATGDAGKDAMVSSNGPASRPGVR
jgi:hypothetical protein